MFVGFMGRENVITCEFLDLPRSCVYVHNLIDRVCERLENAKMVWFTCNALYNSRPVLVAHMIDGLILCSDNEAKEVDLSSRCD
jgi:hypothetical protein